MRRGVGKMYDSQSIRRWQRDMWRSLVSKSKTLYIFSYWSSGALWRLILFYCAFFETVPKAVQMRSTDEDYGSLACDGALLLRVLLCVSRAFLVRYVLRAS